MGITELGVAIQIRIWYEDAERLKALKLCEEEPWYKVVKRVLDEHAAYKAADIKGEQHEENPVN